MKYLDLIVARIEGKSPQIEVRLWRDGRLTITKPKGLFLTEFERVLVEESIRHYIMYRASIKDMSLIWDWQKARAARQHTSNRVRIRACEEVTYAI